MSIDLRDLLSSRKFLPIYEARKNRPDLGPVAVELHWTAGCNYKCIHCSYGDRRKTHQRLSDDVISMVIDDLIRIQTRAVYLSGGGEPTTVKNWEQYAFKLMDAGIEVALITNGSLLPESRMDVLKRMNYIAISIYSSDRNEYQSITGGNFFERQFLLPSIIKGSDDSPVIGARCVLNKINYKNLASIYHHAMNARFDYIIFIPAVDYEQRGIHLRKREIMFIKRIIETNLTVFDVSKTNVPGLFQRNIHYYEGDDYRDQLKSTSLRCKALEIRGNAFVNYDGNVYLCQPHIGNEKYCIGDVRNQRFNEMWNSERHAEVIELLNEQFSLGRCRNCRSINFNKAVCSDGIYSTDIEHLKPDYFI